MTTKRALNLVKPTAAESTAILSQDMPPPTRPVLLESATFRSEVERKLREVNGEIGVLDATEAQAQERCDAEIEAIVTKRDAERQAQMSRRGDLLLIREACAAALRASTNIEEMSQ